MNVFSVYSYGKPLASKWLIFESNFPMPGPEIEYRHFLPNQNPIWQMNHIAINSSIWTTNSQCLSDFEILKFAAQISKHALLSSCEIKAWKKFRLGRDSNPWPLDTGEVLYQLTASHANWELPVTLWVRNIFVDGEDTSEYIIHHILELRRKIWRHDSLQLYAQLRQLWN